MNLLDLNDDILGIIFSPQKIGQLGCTVLRYVCKKSAEYVGGIHLSPQRAYEDAAIHGHVQLYDWIREASGKLCLGSMEMIEAVRGGHLEFIQRLHRDCPKLCNDMCNYASDCGHFHIIQWLVSVGVILPGNSFSAACKAGRLDMMQWTDDILNERRAYLSEEASGNAHFHPPLELCVGSRQSGFIKAAEKGHIHVLEWARSRNYKIGKDVACGAGREGHTDVLDWIVSKNYELNPDEVASGAVAYNQINVLKWLKSHGYSFIISKNALHTAAARGFLPLLKYLHSEGISFPPKIAKSAPHHAETIQWFVSIGFRPKPSWIPRAIEHGAGIDVLNVLLSLGCELSTAAYRSAARLGIINILNWLRTNRCPWDDTVVDAICTSYNIYSLRWLCAHRGGRDVIAAYAALPTTSPFIRMKLRQSGCIQ